MSIAVPYCVVYLLENSWLLSSTAINSREYEMGGGVGNSERIRKIRSSRLKASAAQALDENAKTA